MHVATSGIGIGIFRIGESFDINVHRGSVKVGKDNFSNMAWLVELEVSDGTSNLTKVIPTFIAAERG